MPSSIVESTIDVAVWFLDRARHEDNYLQAQKLQRLLYIAYGLYGAQYHGRKLMPATFVAHELGPIEPNIFRLFEGGRPKLEEPKVPAEIEHFLEDIWRRFSAHPVDRLTHMVTQQKPYQTAFQKGEWEELESADIVRAFQKRCEPEEIVRTADGRRVQKWMPQKAKSRPANS
ncbi:MAG: hypothetical protein CMM48_09770 [Rhodospirillaceae bacterium]|nr:hypothetical protein [Rhodospirillaceae bacterium]HAA91835.1 hypothetical protein [Rhodospirillaceae bacterium]